jgi:hypothetical protein
LNNISRTTNSEGDHTDSSIFTELLSDKRYSSSSKNVDSKYSIDFLTHESEIIPSQIWLPDKPKQAEKAAPMEESVYGREEQNHLAKKVASMSDFLFEWETGEEQNHLARKVASMSDFLFEREIGKPSVAEKQSPSRIDSERKPLEKMSIGYLTKKNRRSSIYVK